MSSHINEQVCGEYNHLGDAIVYGDSVAGDTIINTTMGDMTIEKAYAMGNKFWNQNSTGKEYSHKDGMKVKTYSPEENNTYFGDINYIYRHRTYKSKWKITDSDGNQVVVTGDHSVMVEREGELVEVKPNELRKGDVLIAFEKYKEVTDAASVKRTTISEVEQLDDFKNEYVYDVGMLNDKHNWFYGNGLLLKNTDSVVDDSVINTDHGNMTVEELFDSGSLKWNKNNKEYSVDERIKTLAYDPVSKTAIYKSFNYVYRHKTKKVLWRITDEDGGIIEVTEDHSVMVERGDELVEVKPVDLRDDDVLIKVIE